MNLIREMLSYPFLVRALAGGMMVSLCASLLGVSLVLRRYSMIGDGLSHVSFGALSIALAMGWSPLRYPFRWWFWPLFSCFGLRRTAGLKAMRPLPSYQPAPWR